jgi:hypothetical protein
LLSLTFVRLLLRSTFGFLALLAAIVVARPAQAATPVEAAVARARAAGLADLAGWQRLLHYRPSFWGGVASDVGSGAFFLAPNGRDDPGAELDATLRAFYAPLVPGHEDAHALCRFPARRAWLDDRLRFDGPQHTPSCPALARYAAGLDADSVAVVYASNYLANPASSFGHLFLRLRRRHAPGPAADTAVDYAAEAKTKNPVLYAAAGLTGGFTGYFRLERYDLEMREYLDDQGRDLWEYDLALTPGEVSLLVLHLWELTPSAIPFFYLTGNCAYQIVAALEAAAPRLDVVARLDAIVLPADAVKALVAVPGLAQAIHYLPAALAVPADKAPHESHGSMRVSFGAGATTQPGGPFGSVGFRLALHDLLDPPDGEPELAELQFLDVRIRYDLERRSTTLDSLTFAEVLALNPLTRAAKPVSWRARAFGVRLHDRGCPDCFAHGLDGGLGATLATADERVAVFLLGDAYVAFSPALDGIGGSFVRAGVGPWGGVRIRLPLRTVALVTGSFSYLPVERAGSTYDLRAGLRSSLGEDAALGVEAAAQPYARELQLSTYFYF